MKHKAKILQKHVRVFLEELEKDGIELDQPVQLSGSGHYRIIFRRGPHTVLHFFACSPSDTQRGFKNSLAQVRRAFAMKGANGASPARPGTTESTRSPGQPHPGNARR